MAKLHSHDIKTKTTILRKNVIATAISARKRRHNYQQYTRMAPEPVPHMLKYTKVQHKNAETVNESNSKFWFTTSFLQPLPSYIIGSWKLSANEQFFVGAQTVLRLLQTTQIKQGVSFIAANKVYTSTNKTTIVWIETELLFFTRGGCVSCLRACFGARLLLQSYHYPNLSEGADRVGGQLRGDKECSSFSGVTKSGRVWRKVPESDARSV